MPTIQPDGGRGSSTYDSDVPGGDDRGLAVEASVGEGEGRLVEPQLDPVGQRACEAAVRDGGGGGDAVLVGVGDLDLDW